MYILQYDYVAILLNIINLIVFIFIKNLNDSKSKVLFLMLINSLFCTAFDVLSSLAIGHPEAYPQIYAILVTHIYYLLNNNKIFIYLIYVLLMTEKYKRFSKLTKFFISIPYIMTSTIILINPFTNKLFSIDENLVYHRGIGLQILYIIGFAYLLFSTLSAFSRMKEIDRTIFRSLVSFVFIYILSIMIQSAYPQYLVQSFCTAVSELIMLMVLQNRNEVTDGMTQLYNANTFHNRIQRVFEENSPVSVTLVMLEDTSRINYSFGYGYLKLIIQKIARFIKKELNADEKYYIRDGCFVSLSMNNAEKGYFEIKEKTSKQFMNNWNVNDLSISLSARICQLKIPEQVKSYSEVYDYIDNFTTAKPLANQDMQLAITEIEFSSNKREQEVRKAIALGMVTQTFEVYYQPIYSVRDRKYISAEALVRLKDPDLGFIPPDEFIPLTERDGTITKLGMQIFEMVCSFLKYAKLDEKGIQYIEVNLSVVQCMQKSLKEQLFDLMNKYQIRPEQVCLEITETVAVKTPEIVRKLFQELDKHGISFALDDYGSGYSNVKYIIELPFDFVKLDKYLIWNYFKNDFDKIAFESTITMMKSLNIEMIAEGVETKQQADTLAKLGVNYLQGYYFSKPIPPDDFIDFITTNNTF